MAAHAQRGTRVVFDQELAEFVAVGVVAGGALHFLVVIESDFFGECARIHQFTAGRDQRVVVAERDGMIVREIGAKVYAP